MKHGIVLAGSGGTGKNDDMSLIHFLTRIMEGNYQEINNAFIRSPYFVTKDQAHQDKWLLGEKIINVIQ